MLLADQMDVSKIEEEIKALEIADALRYFTEKFPGGVVFSTSLGQEAQVLADIIFTNRLSIRVFTVDTGRLFTETYQLLQLTQQKYGNKIDIFFPGHEDVEHLVKQYGINCFYNNEEQRRECCKVRKMLPMQRAMDGAKVWISGMRTSQSKHRSSLKKLSWNNTYNVIKFNPLSDWTLEQVNSYLTIHKVPVNTLHEQGYISIGCAPCTKPVEKGEDIRSGRWWWEKSEKECGLNL